MKLVKSIVAGVFASAIVASGASATTVVATGIITINKGVTVTCNARWVFDNSSGAWKLNALALAPGDIGCSLWTPTTPFPKTMVGPLGTQFIINNLGFNSPIGNCVPGNVTVNWDGVSTTASVSLSALGGSCYVY